MQKKEYKFIWELQAQKLHFDLKIKSYLFWPKHVLDNFILETAFELQLQRFQQKTGSRFFSPEVLQIPQFLFQFQYSLWPTLGWY